MKYELVLANSNADRLTPTLTPSSPDGPGMNTPPVFCVHSTKQTDGRDDSSLGQNILSVQRQHRL